MQLRLHFKKEHIAWEIRWRGCDVRRKCSLGCISYATDATALGRRSMLWWSMSQETCQWSGTESFYFQITSHWSYCMLQKTVWDSHPQTVPFCMGWLLLSECSGWGFSFGTLDDAWSYEMKQPVNPKNTSHEKSARVDVVYAGNAVYAVFQKGDQLWKVNHKLAKNFFSYRW